MLHPYVSMRNGHDMGKDERALMCVCRAGAFLCPEGYAHRTSRCNTKLPGCGSPSRFEVAPRRSEVLPVSSGSRYSSASSKYTQSRWARHGKTYVLLAHPTFEPLMWTGLVDGASLRWVVLASAVCSEVLLRVYPRGCRLQSLQCTVT